jgi:cytochrome c-type biogenesis protein CcmH/NrfF
VKRVCLTALLLLLIAPAASLAAACPKTSLADVEDEVMCPVCGVPLGLATEAPQANRERAFIQREVEACKSKQQIKNELVAQFGDRVLALPPQKGFNFVAYLVPALVVLGGVAAVTAVALRRRRRSDERSPGASTPALAGDDAARLEADLERYDL